MTESVFFKGLSVTAVNALQRLNEKLLPNIATSIGVSKDLLSGKFDKYVENRFDRNSKVTLLHKKGAPVGLDEIYVGTKLVPFSSHGDAPATVTSLQLFDRLRENCRYLIRGTGGAGKTVLMKFLWLKSMLGSELTIPIFVELRKLNTFTSGVEGFLDLETFIKYELTSGANLEADKFSKLLEKGLLHIFLDGFDEVNEPLQNSVEEAILSFAARWPNCSIVVTTREIGNLGSWTSFEHLKVLGLTKSQVTDLVKKSQVGGKAEKEFLKLLTSDFYKEYRTFLSVPLLALMMLITFRRTGDVSSSRHKFYESVFITLYEEHDASKDVFSRERHLSVLEMQRFLAAFSLLTYRKGKSEFEFLQILDWISKTTLFLNKNPQYNVSISAQPADILKDIQDSLCLIVRDGDSYSFAHRSFQEYFAAYFAVSMESTLTSSVLHSFSKRRGDLALSLAFEMASARVIEGYIIPMFRKFDESGAFNLVEENNLVGGNSNDFACQIAFFFSHFEQEHIDEIKEMIVASSSWDAFEQDLHSFGYLQNLPTRTVNTSFKSQTEPNFQSLNTVEISHVKSFMKELGFMEFGIEKDFTKKDVRFYSFIENQDGELSREDYELGANKEMDEIGKLIQKHWLVIGKTEQAYREKIKTILVDIESTIKSAEDAELDDFFPS